MPTNAIASSAQENLTAAQEILASATAWVSTNGIKFALSLLGAIAIYVVGTWVAGLIRSALINSLNRRGTDQTVNTYIANILHGLILVMVIVTALGQIGIPTAQFAALIAAAGLAIGLALQQLLVQAHAACSSVAPITSIDVSRALAGRPFFQGVSTG